MADLEFKREASVSVESRASAPSEALHPCGIALADTGGSRMSARDRCVSCRRAWRGRQHASRPGVDVDGGPVLRGIPELGLQDRASVHDSVVQWHPFDAKGEKFRKAGNLTVSSPSKGAAWFRRKTHPMELSPIRLSGTLTDLTGLTSVSRTVTRLTLFRHLEQKYRPCAGALFQAAIGN